ncbi:MAG: energy-coupling factor transporter transmembrane component T family protein [Christensenellales bacterium]|jgi:energy-coupling factor transport system permease protein
MKKPDPRVMLLIAACFSTMGVLIETTWLLTAVFAFAVLFGIALRADMMVLIRRLKGLIGVVVFVALMQSIFVNEGRAIISVGSLDILTTGGLLLAANTLLRIGTVIASAAIFLLTTSRMMIQGLIQLKVPYEFAFMASVALRFLPVFSEAFRDTVTAIQLRGVDLKKIRFREKIKMYISIMTPVTYGAVDKAQKLSYAMELRAFRAYPKRTSRLVLKLSGMDYAYIAVIPLLTAAVLAYYYLYL